MRIETGAAGLLLTAALLAGCDRTPAPVTPVNETAAAPAAVPAPTPAASAGEATRPTDAWIGRWTGPEGLFLEIAAGDAPGRYAMIIKGDLDSRGDRVTGTAEGATIRFERHDTAETLRATDGDGTGLKWLAGKKDCLVVKPGEGFCRG